MAVVEFMMHAKSGGTQREFPGFVQQTGHHVNPDDHTLIGWVDDNPMHYIPETIVYLTKEEFVQRQLSIHANHPFKFFDRDVPVEERRNLTEDEVREEMEDWYDWFVADNTK